MLFYPHAMDYDDQDDEEGAAYIPPGRRAGGYAIAAFQEVDAPATPAQQYGGRRRQRDRRQRPSQEARLKLLDLYGGTITDAGAKMLAASSDLKNLESLEISGNQLTQAGIDALKATGITISGGEQHDEGDDEWLFMGDIE